MLEVQWEYLENNICVDNKPVAIMRPKDNPHERILSVYEAHSCHCCIISPQYSFLKAKQVPYSVEAQKLKENYAVDFLEKLSTHDSLVLKLKEGCKIIEEDCIRQAERISKLI